MQRFNRITLGVFLICALLAAAASADEAKKKATLAICEISPIAGVAERAQRDRKKNELDQIIQSLDGQLIAGMNNTRKFTIVAHSDLPAIIQGGVFSSDTLKKMSNTDYVLVATVDSFQDTFSPSENSIAYRAIQFSIVAKIWKTATGDLLETANFQGVCSIPNQPGPNSGSDPLDKVLVITTRAMAEKVGNHVAYTIYPPKVVDITDGLVTINCGGGMIIKTGDKLDVFAPKIKKDPDTGEDVVIEIPVGQVEITSFTPKTSTAKIVKDTAGIAEGCIVRKQQNP